jgi:hypothetical protein
MREEGGKQNSEPAASRAIDPDRRTAGLGRVDNYIAMA